MSHRLRVIAVQWVDRGMGWASGEGKKKRKVSVCIIAAVRDHDRTASKKARRVQERVSKDKRRERKHTSFHTSGGEEEQLDRLIQGYKTSLYTG
jgi:hypothetical protein